MSVGSIICGNTPAGKIQYWVTVKAGMTEVRLPCEVVGPFSIHRTIYPEPGMGITLTHTRSGLVVRRFSSRKIAREVAAALVELGDWDRSASKLPKSLKVEAGKTINRLAPLSQ